MTIALILAGYTVVMTAVCAFMAMAPTADHDDPFAQPGIPAEATPETLAYFYLNDPYPDITTEHMPDWFDSIPIGIWR